MHESIHNIHVLNLLIEKSGILAKEERLDPWLAKILITELLWGKKHLGGDSKPVKTVLSYKQKLLNVLNSSDVCGIKNEKKNTGNYCIYFAGLSNAMDRRSSSDDDIAPVPENPIVNSTAVGGTVQVLGYFVLYSLAMFTLPFLAYIGTKYTLQKKFDIDGFANTVWSVLSAVIVTNVIIIMYACKGYNDDIQTEETKISDRSNLNEKKTK